MKKLKDLIGGSVVGAGSDYLVIKIDNNRYLVEIKPDSKVNLLKNATTPYGSQF